MRTSGAVHDSTRSRRELGVRAHGRTSSTSSTTRPAVRGAREERSMPELVDIAELSVWVDDRRVQSSR